MKACVDNASPEEFLDRYIKFMRTPGSHNDTYASTAHRMFFKNLMDKKKPLECADNDGHNTDAIDALTLTVPVILSNIDTAPDNRNKLVKQYVSLTRKTDALDRYLVNFSDLLVNVVKGRDLRDAVADAFLALQQDGVGRKKLTIKDWVDRQGNSDPMVACYIDSSYPALLHFAYKYGTNPEQAVLASANAGGENVARGSLLGALLGAAHGAGPFPSWSKKLYQQKEIDEEIAKFVNVLQK